MKLFVFIGASGSGKSTIQHNLPLRFLTHYTTRALRTGEVDGYHIKQVSFEEIEELRLNGKLATMTTYGDNHYASPIEFVHELLENKIPYHATATVDNANQFKNLLGKEKVVVIYIKPPEIAVLKNRMLGRGDNIEDVYSRIANLYSTAEMDNEKYADYVIINDNLDIAIEQAYAIVQKELDIVNIGQFREKKEQLQYEDSSRERYAR